MYRIFEEFPQEKHLRSLAELKRHLVDLYRGGGGREGGREGERKRAR